jgi:hypothetical protein
LDAAVLEAPTQDIQLGQYLVDTERLGESLLLAALCLYNLVCSGLLTPRSAAELLKSFEDARQEINSSPANSLSLFDFLRASGYLNEDRRKNLMLLMKQKQSMKIEEIRAILLDPPALSKILLKEFKADAQLINSALVLHQLVASNKLTVDQALVSFGFLQSGLAISQVR